MLTNVEMGYESSQVIGQGSLVKANEIYDSLSGFTSLQIKYKALRERHRMVVRRCLGAEEDIAASNLVYDQLDVRLDESVEENKELEDKLRVKRNELERVKEQSLKWCSEYMEKDHAMQTQSEGHMEETKALCDRVKDLQEGNKRLDAIVEMQRLKLESFDDTWQAIRETTLKHAVASERKYMNQARKKGKRKATEESNEEENMDRRRENKIAE
ncbi:hypothetical protein QFC21_002551 [Naganishia friedmannii]|uniref:Uncharacterized protein n=1 Tax=Naganishia friedmannii TaxID=89922 RepID=A0ACC2VVN7_9TREE|nr:hypothetical protein QFC21_002551 [Naganishia friedmannii]